MKLYHLNRVNRSSEYQQFTTKRRLFSIHLVSRIKNSYRIQVNITNSELLFEANISKVVDDQWLFSFAINMFPFLFIFTLFFSTTQVFKAKHFIPHIDKLFFFINEQRVYGTIILEPFDCIREGNVSHSCFCFPLEMCENAQFIYY